MAGPPNLGYEILGAVKVKDGLFIGDELAAQDLEFVVANKVTRVVNCCGRQVPNHWESIGVVYLTYYWVDTDAQVILDPRDVVATEIFKFIEDALEGAESVLIHSVRGQSRSCCVLAAYMMKKYTWGLRKTMEFLSSRRPDLTLKPAFLQQLSAYERRLMGQSKVPFSVGWDEADFSRLECEELLLRNTYLNSQMGPLAEFDAGENFVSTKLRRLLWRDNNMDDKIRLEKPAGADRHNALKRDQQGRPILTGVLKKPKALPQGTAASSVVAPGVGGRQENPEVQHPPSAVAAAASVTSSLAPSITTASEVSRAWQQPNSTPAPANMAVPFAAKPMHASAPIQAQPNMAGVPKTPPELVPAARPTGITVDASETMPGMYIASTATEDVRLSSTMPTSNASMAAPSSSTMSGQPALPLQVRGSGPPVQTAPTHVASMPRGPATNIRDSLSTYPSRRVGSDGGSRPPSRDPSPKTGPGSTGGRRGDSPTGSVRSGEHPARTGGVQARPSRGSSPGTGGYPSVRNSAPAPAVGNLGFCLGSIRSGTGPPQVAPVVRPSSAGACPAMGAFRSGGPVRAKADLLADGHNPAMKRNRPISAGARMGGPGGGRPASPLPGGGSLSRASSTGSGTGSRPPSPQTRAPSPGASKQASMSGSGPIKHRSLSSHMRRAPSPTPAFNRNPSPSKPRWRS